MAHSPNLAEARSKWTRRGGQEAQRKSKFGPLPLRDLDTLEGLNLAIVDLHRALSRGRISESRVRVLLDCLKVKLSALDARQLEERISKLEERDR